MPNPRKPPRHLQAPHRASETDTTILATKNDTIRVPHQPGTINRVL